MLIAVVSLYFTVAFNIAFYKKVVELNGGQTGSCTRYRCCSSSC